MKKLISVALVALMAAGSVITANAKTVKQHDGIEILSSVKNISDNTLLVSAYNIPQDYKNGVMFKGGESLKQYKVPFSDCINGDKTVFMPSTEKYARYMLSGSGNIYASHSFADKGGRYVKAKINLNKIDSQYFNKDGSHTMEYTGGDSHDYKFKYEDFGKGQYYDSALYFQSGGAVTGVVPDKDGCAVIYLSANVKDHTDFCTSFSNTRSAGGGTTGRGVYQLNFGNLNFDYSVNINDVSLLQQYIAGDAEFDSLQLFYADINFDGKTSVQDVTAFQSALAE